MSMKRSSSLAKLQETKALLYIENVRVIVKWSINANDGDNNGDNKITMVVESCVMRVTYNLRKQFNRCRYY